MNGIAIIVAIFAVAIWLSKLANPNNRTRRTSNFFYDDNHSSVGYDHDTLDLMDDMCGDDCDCGCDSDCDCD